MVFIIITLIVLCFILLYLFVRQYVRALYRFFNPSQRITKLRKDWD